MYNWRPNMGKPLLISPTNIPIMGDTLFLDIPSLPDYPLQSRLNPSRTNRAKPSLDNHSFQ